tara:strand:+ start:7644 stop:7982 length:339 start_codon:yes stop_codon:yes gene_type:complete
MASTKNMGRAMSKWTAKEIDYLRDNYSFLNAGLIAQFLNRGVGAVRAKASSIGISNPQKAWTRKEECLLRELYPINSVNKTAAFLGRKRGSVVSRARLLGLKINFEAMSYGS